MESGINYLANIYKKRVEKHKGDQKRYDDFITPETLSKIKTITDGFLVGPGKSPIQFTGFSLREIGTERPIFEIHNSMNEGNFYATQNLTRFDLTREFLKIPALCATIEFKVGPEPIQELRMIERHFYRGKLLISYDFNFGFCIPHSVNTWEHTYEFPSLPQSILRGMVAEPYETKSDSFYFANSSLILHNKAEYSFCN